MESGVSLETIQQYELEILRYVHNVCKENNIKYYLAYGSLLGAIRHHGFIPWDDDIDIYMPRPDYIKFLEITNSKPDDRYKVCSIDNEPRWTASLPKVIDTYTVLRQKGHREKMDLGLYIDIFVIDGVPADLIERTSWIKRLNLLHKIWVGCEYDKKIISENKLNLRAHGIVFASKVLNVVVGANRAAKKLCKEARKYSFEECDFVGDNECQVPRDREKCIVEKEWFDGECYMEFEDLLCPVPSRWHELLTKWYGDYMQLPAEQDRISHHKYNLELKDNLIRR